MADETSFCKHCKRLVPSATLILHSTHCERFIQICQRCEEPIPRAQMEQHEHEVHKLINCKNCNEKVEKRAENDHLANHCSKRLISCGYCEIQCIATAVQDHELACGSRTEQCDICKNHILVRMLKIHEELHNSSSPFERSTDHSPTSSRAGPCDVDDAYWSRYAVVPPATEESMIDEEDSIPCEVCENLFPISCLELHQIACKFSNVSVETKVAIRKKETLTQRPASPCDADDDATEESVIDEEDSIPCEVCENLFPISCLELHQIACKFSNVSVETEVTIRKKETLTQRPASPCGADDDYWSQHAAIAPVAEQNKAMKEISIPCEYCGTVFPISCLDIHEISCKFSSVSTQSAKTSGISEKIGSIASPSQHYSEPEPALLPCSFCNIIVSSSILEMHEARCRPFSEQQLRRSQSATVSTAHLGSQKPPVKNTRIENVAQRSLRNNALMATENRLPTTPKIKQSQYAVVQLPDGQEIFRKRNQPFDTNGPDVGHVLGHGQPQERRDNGSLILHTAVYTNPTNGFESPNFGFETNTMETNKSLFNEYDREKYSGPISRARKNHALEAVQKQNAVQKNDGILPTDPSVGIRITKKPKSAFKNYAYQPDSGNKLGGGNSSLVGGDQQNGRDYNNALGARPKMRPQRPADKFHT